MSKILVHIPHSSLKITSKFRNRLLIDENSFNMENKFLCDNDVHTFVPHSFNIVRFNYSRTMCDVERYRDNTEEMNKYGMGYIYTKTSTKEELIKTSNSYIKYIDTLYEKHHKRVDDKVTDILKTNDSCVIIDLHSYSDELVKRLFNRTNNPDICIGINNYYDKELLDFTTKYFNDAGYSTKINYPYSGSLIPNKYMNDKRVKSMMIEINKRIYSEEFKNIMYNYFKLLRRKYDNK